MKPLSFQYTQGCGKVERKGYRRYGKVTSIEIMYVARWVRSGACRGRDKSGEAERFSVRGRAAALPTARSSQKCEELRRALGTWSSGSPSIGRSDRCKSPRWDRACV